MRDLMRLGHSDWAIHAAFYTQYHCLLALLALAGYESRNQECTFTAIKMLIDEGRIQLSREFLRSLVAEPDSSTLVTLREHYQYGVATEYGTRDITALFQSTLRLLEECKRIIEEKRT